ncbi:MAG: hypothetical protein HFJ40_05105 [Clostridia bacterium]|nr:hypothetical protein [Clostridia bacterium]
MSIFKKDEKATTRNVKFKCSDVYVLTTTIVPDSDEKVGTITYYFLATKREEEYYELFSDMKLEKEPDTYSDKDTTKQLDKPYIKKVEPLKEYMMDKKAKRIKRSLLFEFIISINVDNIVDLMIHNKN